MDQSDNDKERIRQLEKELKAHRAKVDAMEDKFSAMLRESGLERAIYVGIEQVQKALEPLQSFAPVRKFGREREAIVALRRSLRRPDYETLETNFGPAIPGVDQSTEETAA